MKHRKTTIGILGFVFTLLISSFITIAPAYSETAVGKTRDCTYYNSPTIGAGITHIIALKEDGTVEVAEDVTAVDPVILHPLPYNAQDDEEEYPKGYVKNEKLGAAEVKWIEEHGQDILFTLSLRRLHISMMLKRVSPDVPGGNILPSRAMEML